MEDKIVISESSSEEEISLIDLFAVLLKYRKLIIIGTLLVTFLAGLYLFVLPKVSSKSDKKRVDVSYHIKLNDLPSLVGEYFSHSVAELAVCDMTDVNVVASGFEKHSFLDYDFSGSVDRSAYYRFIKNLIDKEKIVVKAAPLRDHLEVVLLCDSDKIASSRDYLKLLVENTNKKLENFVMTQLNEDLKKLETAILVLGSNLTPASDTTDYQEVVDDKNAIETFISDYKSFLVLDDGALIVSESSGRGKKLVIVFLAAFFLTVFISFVLNAVSNIKADPVASKKISDAWKAGK